MLDQRAIWTTATVAAAACNPGVQANPVTVENVSPSEVQALLKNKSDTVFLLDVRTPDEHNSGHLPGTDANADWRDWQQNFSRIKDRLSPDEPVVLYCASGRRSASAAEWLMRHGFTKVYNMTGGIAGWVGAGLPVSKLR